MSVTWDEAERGQQARQQIDRLASYITDKIPGEPSQDQGAVDTAIRLLSGYRFVIDLLSGALDRMSPGQAEILRDAGMMVSAMVGPELGGKA
jgi:hypothetical protein